MYQLNMANPMINKIDGILADAKVAQRNPTGFTPKVEQPLVVQTKGYDVQSATKQAGIKENNESLSVEDRNRIADAAAAGSKASGQLGAVATTVAVVCGESVIATGPCGVPSAAIATGATATGFVLDGVEQLARPNMGQTVNNTLLMLAQRQIDNKLPLIAPITNETFNLWKDSKSNKNFEDWLNSEWLKTLEQLRSKK